MKRTLRFVPYKVQHRDFRKWAKGEGYTIPSQESADYDNIYVVLGGLTADDLEAIFNAGFKAAEKRQKLGGAGCGE